MHGIYVFIGIALFYNKILKEKLNHNVLEKRQENISKMVYFAFQQVDECDLTQYGKELLIKLYMKFINFIRKENIDISPDIEIQKK